MAKQPIPASGGFVPIEVPVRDETVGFRPIEYPAPTAPEPPEPTAEPVEKKEH